MNVLRRLIKQPVLLMWVLAAIAILLNYTDVAIYGPHGSGSQHAAAHKQDAQAMQQVAEQHQAQMQNVDSAHMGAAPANAASNQVVAIAEIAQNHSPSISAQQVAVAPSANDLLRAAREAYWSNEYGRAIEFYQALIQQVPNNLAYQGELANVYWWQGNTQKAAELFSQLAPQLATQGRQQEALNMKLYVEMVNPELAKSIPVNP